jgi:hypothetical protein
LPCPHPLPQVWLTLRILEAATLAETKAAQIALNSTTERWIVKTAHGGFGIVRETLSGNSQRAFPFFFAAYNFLIQQSLQESRITTREGSKSHPGE